MRKSKKIYKLSGSNTLRQSNTLPIFIYAKTFGDTFLFMIILSGLSISMIANNGFANFMDSFKYIIKDISILPYLIMIMGVTILAIYSIIIWVYILSKNKYLKIENEEIIYKCAFTKKVIPIERVKYIDFEYCNNGILKAKRTGMLFKCDNDVDRVSSTDLFVNYFEFSKEELKVVVNAIFKFDK